MKLAYEPESVPQHANYHPIRVLCFYEVDHPLQARLLKMTGAIVVEVVNKRDIHNEFDFQMRLRTANGEFPKYCKWRMTKYLPQYDLG